MCDIIPAVKSNDEFNLAVEGKANVIFHLTPNIMTLADNVTKAHAFGKKLFVHIDFAEGIGKDKYGLCFVKGTGADGIISTRTNIIKLAREEGLFTVQRFFLVDSHSIDTLVESLKSSKADMIEIMPGVATRAIEVIKNRVDTPIIAGGLVEDKTQVQNALSSGATAVSTSKTELW